MALIQVQNLTRRVPDSGRLLTILDDVSFTVQAGETVAIIGASGSGKSTLLGLLAGLDLPSSGDVQVDGQSLFARDEEQRARWRAEEVGFVFQSFQLLPAMTALENVMLPLELAAHPKARQTAEAPAGPGRAGRAGRTLSAHALGRRAAAGGAGPCLCRVAPAAVCRRADRQPRSCHRRAGNRSALRDEPRLRRHADPGHARSAPGRPLRPPAGNRPRTADQSDRPVRFRLTEIPSFEGMRQARAGKMALAEPAVASARAPAARHHGAGQPWPDALAVAEASSIWVPNQPQ